MKNRSGLIIVGILILLVLWGGSAYNGLVVMDENVKKAWGNVETQYQRRMDLITQLVNTVKGERDFEQETLVEVTKARASATALQVSADDLTPEKLQQLNARQGDLTQALGRLMVSMERYPNLRANDAFRSLQVAIEGTENRINTARVDFNNVATQFNQKVRKFPGNIVASIFGFDYKPLFESDEAAKSAPDIDFSKESGQ